MADPADPYSADYDPQYTDETDDGDVGSGEEFGAHLYVLYAAGRVHLPRVAATYAGLTEQLNEVRPYAQRCAETTPGALDRVVGVFDDLQLAFGTTSRRLDKAGQGLVAIADDYVRTDEAAAQSFRDWLTKLGTVEERNALDDPPIEVPEAPSPGDPAPDIGPSPHGPLPTPGEL